MGGNSSKSRTKTENQSTPGTATSTVKPAPHLPVTTAQCSETYPIQNNLEHLILAFFAGVLLTLLLLTLVFLILKSCRKRHSHAQTLEPQLDSCSEIAAKSSSAQEALIYANMTFNASEKKSPYLTANPSANSDSVVYSQIKGENSPLPCQ